MTVPSGRTCVSEQERTARAALARVVEPGHPGLHCAVQQDGPCLVWDTLRAGGPVPGLLPGALAGAHHRAKGYEPRRDLDRLDACGGRLLCPGDSEWPAAQLSWLPDQITDAPPLALHVRGGQRLDQVAVRAVAIVGARAASSYGELVSGQLALGVADRGVTVISGAAYGIDGAAHQGALGSGRAATVAVLACGVDVAYPKGHERLLDRIVEQGLVISELPTGSAPTRGRFLVRNRLIAALSQGTVVVEAARRSGSLATADRAGGLVRVVMAVPGPVTSATSAGSNDLLRRVDVRCVTNAQEVVELVGRFGADAAVPPEREQRPRDVLPAVVRQVLDAVPVRAAAGVASIARTAGVSPLVVQQVLPPLVLHGLIEQRDAGWRLTSLGAARPG